MQALKYNELTGQDTSSLLKTPQLAQYGVKIRLKMLIYGV